MNTISHYQKYQLQTDGSGTLKNTGTIGDEVCHINDMTSNIREWTTENSNYANSSFTCPYVTREGIYDLTGKCTSFHSYSNATYSSSYVGFRPALYVM